MIRSLILLRTDACVYKPHLHVSAMNLSAIAAVDVAKDVGLQVL